MFLVDEFNFKLCFICFSYSMHHYFIIHFANRPFWWFDLQPLKIVTNETWKNLDEKAWVEKHTTLPRSNFKWKTLWMNNISCIIYCGSKIQAPSIGIIGYIGYALALVMRQLGGIQYMSRTLGLADFTGSFRNQSSLKELKVIK